MRVFLKWLSGNLHFVQRMPAAQCPHAGEPKEIVSFCDASWGLDSVSGAILVYRGCCVKFFSRKQEVPALSTAEAEMISIVETAKEMVSIGMLLQTMIQGIPLDPLGMPCKPQVKWVLPCLTMQKLQVAWDAWTVCYDVSVIWNSVLNTASICIVGENFQSHIGEVRTTPPTDSLRV